MQLSEVVERYTIKEFEAWEGKWEIIKGIPLAMAPFAFVRHQKIATFIAGELNKNRECNECFAVVESEWYIDKETVVRPDCLFVCTDEKERLTKTPEIIFEIVSPSSAKRDEIVKFDLYENEGVKYYCLVYPDYKKVKIYKNENGFKKVAECYKEEYEFDIICKVSVNFEKVFE